MFPFSVSVFRFPFPFSISSMFLYRSDEHTNACQFHRSVFTLGIVQSAVHRVLSQEVYFVFKQQENRAFYGHNRKVVGSFAKVQSPYCRNLSQKSPISVDFKLPVLLINCLALSWTFQAGHETLPDRVTGR